MSNSAFLHCTHFTSEKVWKLPKMMIPIPVQRANAHWVQQQLYKNT